MYIPIYRSADGEGSSTRKKPRHTSPKRECLLKSIRPCRIDPLEKGALMITRLILKLNGPSSRGRVMEVLWDEWK